MQDTLKLQHIGKYLKVSIEIPKPSDELLQGVESTLKGILCELNSDVDLLAEHPIFFSAIAKSHLERLERFKKDDK